MSVFDWRWAFLFGAVIMRRVYRVACRSVGLDVNGGAVKVRDAMYQLVFYRMRDLVRVADIDVGSDGHGEIGAEAMSFPAHSDVAY
jgi:hypothetical protein